MNQKIFWYVFTIITINILASILGLVVISEHFTDAMLWIIFGVSLVGLLVLPLVFGGIK